MGVLDITRPDQPKDRIGIFIYPRSYESKWKPFFVGIVLLGDIY